MYALAALATAACAAYGIFDPRLGDEEALTYANPDEDTLLLLVAFLFFIAFLAERVFFFTCVFLVCRFTFRAMKNLYTAGSRTPEMSPTGAVLWYFVPFANLVLPSLGMSQIHHASIEETGRLNQSRLVSWWWATWILAIVATVISNNPLLPAEALFPVSTIALLLSATAAILLRRLVLRIADAQKTIAQTGAAEVFA